MSLETIRTDFLSHFSLLPGGRYSSRQNEDGTWDILDVPIFSIVKKGIKRAPRDITEADLKGAVAEHQRQYREDRYAARLNVLHNFGIHKSTPAGFALPSSVRPLRMKGVFQPVVFADFLSISDEVFQAINSNQLPYCSAEVRTYEPLTFGAVALLDTEPPFFEFPLISVGDKEMVKPITSEGPVVALAHFNFQEDPIMPDDGVVKTEGPVEKSEDKGFLGQDKKQYEADLAPPPAVPMEEPAPAPDLGSIVEALVAQVQQMQQQLSSLLAVANVCGSWQVRVRLLSTLSWRASGRQLRGIRTWDLPSMKRPRRIPCRRRF
jgi:hypothetical protein